MQLGLFLNIMPDELPVTDHLIFTLLELAWTRLSRKRIDENSIGAAFQRET
jgi:hypothetical protein